MIARRLRAVGESGDELSAVAGLAEVQPYAWLVADDAP